MREDIAAWFEAVKSLKDTTASNLFKKLATGEVLCEHANFIHEKSELYFAELAVKSIEAEEEQAEEKQAEIKQAEKKQAEKNLSNDVKKALEKRPLRGITKFKVNIKSTKSPIGANQARDNLSQFLSWCKVELKFNNAFLFESNDLQRGFSKMSKKGAKMANNG